MEIIHKKYPNLLTENLCFIEGQGLCTTYDILVYGTGYNNYVFTFKKSGFKTIYEFETHDRLILEWRVRRHPESYGPNGRIDCPIPDPDNEYIDFYIKAFGVLKEPDCEPCPYSFESGECELLDIIPSCSVAGVKPITCITCSSIKLSLWDHVYKHVQTLYHTHGEHLFCDCRLPSPDDL